MIRIENSEKNPIFLFIWLQNRSSSNKSGIFYVKVESMDILTISEESVKILSDGAVYRKFLEKLTKNSCVYQGLEHVLQNLQTLSGAPIYIGETTPRGGEERAESRHYYSLERKNVEGRNYFHRITSEDLSYPHDEGSRETWVRAHCAVIEVFLRLWLRLQVEIKCLAQCFSKIVGQDISLDSSDDLCGADGALFWLVATAARSASLLGVKDCQKWLDLHMAENMRGSHGDQQTDEMGSNEVKKTDRFLRGVAIPNLVALVLCHYLQDYSYHAEFRMNFGKKGELPNADTEHNIDRILQISARHIEPSVMDVLPAPKMAKGGLACEDFACGLARASPQRRLQAAALAGDLFDWAEVRKTSQSQNREAAAAGTTDAYTADNLASGRHTYRLSKGVNKVLQANWTANPDSGTVDDTESDIQGVSGSALGSRKTSAGSHALDALFQRKQDGGPQICPPVFVGSASKADTFPEQLPPVPLNKPVLRGPKPAQGRQSKPPETFPLPPHTFSKRQARPSRPSAEQTSALPASTRRDLSEVSIRTRPVTNIPRPSSQHRYSNRVPGAPLHQMDLNRPLRIDNFEHYQQSLERLSADLEKVQMELKTMAQHGMETLSPTASAAAPQLLTSTMFMPVEDSQQVDVSMAIQQHQGALVNARRYSPDSSDCMEELEEPIVRHQQELKLPATQRQTWDKRITTAGPALLHGSRGGKQCITCNSKLLLSSPCLQQQNSVSSSPTMASLHNLAQPICNTGHAHRSVRRSGRLRRYAVRRNRRNRDMETASSSEPESAEKYPSSVESEGLCSKTGDMVHESPSHLLHMRRRQRQEDERLFLADEDNPKFERTVVAQPPQLPSAAKAVTWTQPEMGLQEKSSPLHEYGDRQVVRPTYASDRDEQSKQKSSEVFVIDLNTIDRIGDLDAASEGRPLSDADIHLSTRKARVLERCKRREEQRRQHRRAVTSGGTDFASGEDNRKVTAKQRRQRRADISQAHINKKAVSAADVCSPTPSTTRRVSPASSTPSHQASTKEQLSPIKGPVSSSRRPASCNHTPLSDPPRLYVQPQTKSNRRVITNALIHCCLAGRVNEQLKVNILQDLGRTDGQHFIILLRGGCQFSGLFRLEPGSEEMVRVGGTGPHRITSSMIERFYKYDSGSKAFSVIETTSHLSTVVDAVTLLRQTQVKLLRNQRQQHPRPQHEYSLPPQLSNEAAVSEGGALSS